MRKRNKIYFSFVLFILILISIFFIVGEWSSSKSGNNSPTRFICVFAFSTMVFVPIYFMSLNSAVIYGFYPGFLYSVLGMLFSSTLFFWLSRLLAKPFIEGTLKERYKRLYELDKLSEKNGFTASLFLRVLPIHFNLVNIFLGVTKIRFRDYILATIVWMVPEIILLTYFGRVFFEFNFMKMLLFIILILFFALFKERIKKRGFLKGLDSYFKKKEDK
jgi:uncharacterized membrane protein YdjX (TVP38/TMEM64 family)